MDLKIGRPADGTTKKFLRDAREGNTSEAPAVDLVVGDDDDDAERALTKANFLDEMEVAIEFYAKFWAEMHFKFFPKFLFCFARKIFTFQMHSLFI